MSALTSKQRVAAMVLRSGLCIGKYELGRKLGEGSFGIVFVAYDTSLDREVALKFLHPSHTANHDVLARFLQEARSAAKIVHSGIVTVFECGQVAGTDTPADGLGFIAMELLHGESLTARLARSGKLELDAAIEIARQVASALDAAHRVGVVHRDLKPDNIFLVRDAAIPGGERVKVLDFGIAKLTQKLSGVQTQSMMVFGTPRYMSPEQCRSATNTDHRSDVYSLGCILHELLVGEPVFAGDVGELLAKHVMVVPAPTRTHVDIPEYLDTLIANMLAKDPANRPQSMAAVQEALASRMPAAQRSDGAAGASLPRQTVATQLGVAERAALPSALLHPIPPATPTTLGAASGESRLPSRLPRGRWPLLVAAAAVGVIAGLVWLVTAGRDTPAPVQAQAIPAPPRAPEPTAPAPTKTIELEIRSTPRAEVYTIDQRLLGETPFVLARPTSEGKHVFILKAEGYVDLRIAMPADASDKRVVSLVEVPKPAKKPRVTARAEAAKPEPEKSVPAPKPEEPACNATDLEKTGQAAYVRGSYVAASTAFDAAYRCKPSAVVAAKLVLAACSAKDENRARQRWHALSPAAKNAARPVCARNGILIETRT